VCVREEDKYTYTDREIDREKDRETGRDKQRQRKNV
jgi:hypothetical protein